MIPDAGGNSIDRRREAENRIRKFIREQELQAFPVVVTEESIPAGLKTILQMSWSGAFKPNTVMMGTSTDQEKWPQYCETLDCRQGNSAVSCSVTALKSGSPGNRQPGASTFSERRKSTVLYACCWGT